MLQRLLTFFCSIGISCCCCARQLDNAPLILVADSSEKQVTIVSNIHISGNSRTKTYIIERELAVVPGREYGRKELAQRLQITHEQLMNTLLFIRIDVRLVPGGDKVTDLFIDVKERWYFFSLPYFKMIDRNWNEWLHTYGADLDRVNYGLKTSENNLSGRNDKLHVWLIAGYTRQVSFNYIQPFIDKKLKQGLLFGFRYARNREVNYSTDYDTLKFIKLPKFARTFVSGNIGYSYRKGSTERQSLRFAYSFDRMDSSVTRLNGNLLGNGRQSVQFADLSYTFQYFKVDYLIYPLRGWYVDLSATKRFSRAVGAFTLAGKYLQSWKFSGNNYFMVQAIGSIRFPFNQPYYNSHLLGYGDLSMRGLEYLVVDGVAGGCLKTTLRKKVFGFTFKNFFKTKNHERIPFTFYAKAFSDLGYVYNKNGQNNSRLSNKMLRTGGFGLDIVTIYDLILKLDFSINQLGNQGFYYHTGADF